MRYRAGSMSVDAFAAMARDVASRPSSDDPAPATVLPTEPIYPLAEPVPAEYVGAECSPALVGLPPWVTMLLYGPAGTGKTRQLWALYQRQTIGAYCRVMIAKASAISQHRWDWAWLQSLIDTPCVLCVDDLGYAKPSPWTVEAVYALADSRPTAGRRTIWTTNLTEQAIAEQYSPAICSRLHAGVTVPTGGEDWRRRAAT